MLIFGQTLKRLRVWPISNLAKPVMLAKPVAAPNSRSSCISPSRKWCSKPPQKKMRMHLEAPQLHHHDGMLPIGTLHFNNTFYFSASL